MLRKQSRELHASIAEHADDMQDFVDALNYLVECSAKTKLSQVNTLRYHRRKIQNKLLAGGYGSNFSKLLSTMLDDVTSTPAPADGTNFKPTDFTVWPEDSAFAQSVREAVGRTNFAEKCESLSGALDQNPRWGGATAKLEAEPDAIGFFHESVEATHIDHPGASPWAVAVRANFLRLGPQSWPLPGLGAYFATDGQTSVTIVAVPVESLLSKGISLCDFGEFMESAGGQEVFKKSARIVTLGAGSVCWCPYGWLSWPLVWKAASDAAKDAAAAGIVGDAAEAVAAEGPADADASQAASSATGAKAAAEPIGYLWHCTVWSTLLVGSITEAAWSAIHDQNTDHLQRQKAKIWTSRRELLEAFLKELADKKG